MYPPDRFPLISICTPTFNRRPFIPYLIKLVLNQTYPLDRIEWIVVDDGTDCVRDIFEEHKDKLPFLKYYRVDTHLNLGRKRNLMHSYSHGDIIIYMDDDDYYPPERVSHAVDMLVSNPNYLIAGGNVMHMWYPKLNEMWTYGPRNQFHATAATFAFRKHLLTQTSYDDDALIAEEGKFLKNHTIPLLALDPLKTILVFSHIHNTADKNILLKHNNPDMRKSENVPSDFIKDEELYNFYTKNMNEVLVDYKLGSIDNKPEIMDFVKKRLQDLEERNNRIYFKTTEDMQKYFEMTIAKQNEQLVSQKKLIDTLIKRLKDAKNNSHDPVQLTIVE